ncbi:phage integrase SAM-like domain-containing protein [Prevotella melaninogenica]|uniref:phage integrase SAM-like domain-containing protein n=1 Tax=Prevotella melaninogenica TaxID=28132 RepID=UPI001BA4EDFE|nr:phage integrase SAM-like domain-containing protein [Prevotella melaninogenica]QUB68682.1 phage integrase SAM-like domain-containing protein [Prevotella melaninogenica]
MATFKALIKKGNKRADGTWNVVIRFTHNSKVRFIPTTMYINKKDITASFKIKNANILDRCNEIIKEYRSRLSELSLEFNDIDIDTIVSYIRQKKENKGVSFTDFAAKWIKESTIKGIKNYKTAISALCSFVGRDNILCEEINVKAMKAFENALKDRPRAQSLYPNCIKTMFNAARDYYNDEDNDIIRIKHSLDRYKPVEQNVAEKRALDIETIRRIFTLPYDNIRIKGKSSRHDLALDCFRLSFCLMGMNSADLYYADRLEDNTIIYDRMKTKDRRRDKAEIHVKITDYIKPLIEKYKGKERVFNFYERFTTMESFNRAINIGLKEIGKELGIERLQFYAARHSMATIAVNDVKISKYIVNDMLNHTDQSLRITELYIKKDFSHINEANVKLLDYVLKA